MGKLLYESQDIIENRSSIVLVVCYVQLYTLVLLIISIVKGSKFRSASGYMSEVRWHQNSEYSSLEYSSRNFQMKMAVEVARPKYYHKQLLSQPRTPRHATLLPVRHHDHVKATPRRPSAMAALAPTRAPDPGHSAARATARRRRGDAQTIVNPHHDTPHRATPQCVVW